MTTSTHSVQTAIRPNQRPLQPATTTEPARREYRERDFGVGYGRSSGYASDRRYANDWNGPIHFRCG